MSRRYSRNSQPLTQAERRELLDALNIDDFDSSVLPNGQRVPCCRNDNSDDVRSYQLLGDVHMRVHRNRAVHHNCGCGCGNGSALSEPRDLCGSPRDFDSVSLDDQFAAAFNTSSDHLLLADEFLDDVRSCGRKYSLASGPFYCAAPGHIEVTLFNPTNCDHEVKLRLLGLHNNGRCGERQIQNRAVEVRARSSTVAAFRHPVEADEPLQLEINDPEVECAARLLVRGGRQKTLLKNSDFETIPLRF